MSKRCPQAGFTLIELMIVVAVVAILAAIALPTYQEQIRKARRADATAVLLEGQQFMERLFTETHAYNVDTGGNAVTSANLPFQISPSSASGSDVMYNIALQAVAAGSYTLRATPANAQATDQCGFLQLQHTGARSCGGIADVDDCLATCWRK